MSQAVRSQLYALGFTLIILSYVMFRRMRPQQVRPSRLLLSGAMIVVLVLLGLVGSGRIISDPVALLLLPVFAAGGVALGYLLVRTLTFWTDEATGALWMRGGVLFALILVGTIVLRLGVRTVAYGSPFGPTGGGGAGTGFAPQSNGGQGLLYDLSADLLILTLGLWAARAYLVLQRYRAHVAGREPASPPTAAR
jgi:hypothetical protein